MREVLKHVFLASLFIAGSSSLMHGQNGDPYASTPSKMPCLQQTVRNILIDHQR